MTVDRFALDILACRGRQQRLIAEMKRLDLDLFITTQVEHVQWLSGVRSGPMFQSAAALRPDGHLTIVVPGRRLPDNTAADQVLGYEAQWHSTLRNDQRLANSQVLLASLGGVTHAKRVGVEFATFPPHVAREFSGELVDLEPTLYQLRRRKDSDELAMMRQSIGATAAMYSAARTLIRPGIDELWLYSQLQGVAVDTLGEPLTYFGQDFQCNSRGGPPRRRLAQAGELYILDLGVGFRGYFSDNARTFSVGNEPSASQTRAWQQILTVFAMIESTVKPGVRCQHVFTRAKELLAPCTPWVFDHHLGHGVGLYPHEAPHLNPHWDDTFAEGDTFTVEPGLYHDELRHGMRLEQNYRVTEDGVELLTDFSLDL